MIDDKVRVNLTSTVSTSTSEGDKIVRDLNMVKGLATQWIGSKVDALDWMKSLEPSLGKKSPLSLVASGHGDVVIRLLQSRVSRSTLKEVFKKHGPGVRVITSQSSKDIIVIGESFKYKGLFTCTHVRNQFQTTFSGDIPVMLFKENI